MKTRGKVIISIILIFGLILGGGAWWVKKNLFDEPFVTHVDPTTGKTIKAFNVLLLGSDARPNEKKGRTDAIIVVQVSQDRISMLSIPRDTRVDIPGHGKQKINAAAYFEKPEVTAEIVSEIIGQPVHKYILVRWEGFMNIVDALGGVDVDIPKNITSYSMDGVENRVDLKQGIQHLDGKAALAFVRFRNAPLGDIYRVNNQLEFMKALAEKSKQPSVLLKLPTVLPELYRNVDTNMNLKELMVLAKAGMDFKDSTILTQALPGYFFNLNGICYWGFDPVQAQQVTYDLFFNGMTTSKVVMEAPPEVISTPKKQPQVAQQPVEKEVVSPPQEDKVDEPTEEPVEDQPEKEEKPDDGTPADPDPNKTLDPIEETPGDNKDQQPTELNVTIEKS